MPSGKVDPDLFCHMALLCHDELIIIDFHPLSYTLKKIKSLQFLLWFYHDIQTPIWYFQTIMVLWIIIQNNHNPESISILFWSALWLAPTIHSESGSKVAGGTVTRFPFGPFNVFVYISHWAARVNSQNKPHFEGDYRNWWLTRAFLGTIELAAGRSNMIMFLCKIGTWYN